MVYWNRAAEVFFGISRTQFLMLRELNQLNVLKLIFDSRLPFRERLLDWHEVALRNLQGFMVTNDFAVHEPWYQQIKAEICALGREEAEIWHQAEVDFRLERSAEYLTRIATPDGPVAFWSVFICPSDFHYPHVAAYLPQDAAAKRVFEDLGFLLNY